VLHQVSFSVDRGDIVNIIGPSGTGKTTLLKLIAGLEEPSSGTIRFERKPSLHDPVILVFQDFILFPNMTVFENVAFGLRTRRVERAQVRKRVNDMLGYFGIADKAGNYPATLSAGQQQRVAIARAMVVGPSVLLLDEPFAHLDRNLRMETAAFIRATQKEFGVTTVSVTHNLEEAFAMSDKIGILLDGRLRQFDTVERVYFQPSDYEVARFLGPVNIIPPELFAPLGIQGTGPPDGPGPADGEILSRGTRSVFARAEEMTIEKNSQGQGLVTDVRFAGVLILYKVLLKGREFTVYSLDNGIARGDRVRLGVSRYVNGGTNMHRAGKSIRQPIPMEG
jgi:putative spermidine/putrescine transport system ATP-binding protein